MDYYVTLKNQEDYILDELRKMDTKNSFKFPYGRFKYLYGMVQRLIRESKQQKEPPAPTPPSKAADRHSWMAELMADNQPPKQASTEDESAISDSDLFDAESDAIHEAWASMDESERRKNWERAIAVHQQQHPPKAYVYDEMY